MPLRDDRCYIIAEFGSSHLGNKEHALEAIRVAAKSGADACKFQLFRLPDILIDPSQGDLRTEMPPEWIPDLAAMCREMRIDFLCTPFSAWAVEVLNQYVEMWKIGSFEYKRADIWKSCITTNKPIIASCGRGEPQTNHWKYPAHKLYCVSKYPVMPKEIRMPNFIECENMFDGFSDHTTSTIIPALAVARGARIIEKHFRLDETPTDSPDYPHSLNPSQLAEMVANIRLAETVCWRQPPATQELAAFPNRREA